MDIVGKTDAVKKSLWQNGRDQAMAMLASGKFERASEMLTWSLEKEPNNMQCLVARAQCYLQIGDLMSAIVDAENILKFDPTFAKAIYIKAEALYLAGEFERSLVYYHRAKDLRKSSALYDQCIRKAQAAIEARIGDGTKLCNIENLTLKTPECEHSNKRKTLKQVRHKVEPSYNLKEDDEQFEPTTRKYLLGPLYEDWRYLKELLLDEDCRIETLHKAEKCALQQRRNILRERRELQTSYGKRNKDQISEPTWSSKVEESQRKHHTEESQKMKQLASRELKYLSDRAHFWRQQKSTLRCNSKDIDSQIISSIGNSVGENKIVQLLEKAEEVNNKGDYIQARDIAERSIETIHKSKEIRIENKNRYIATSFCIIGKCFYKQHMYSEALDSHKQDKRFSEMASDITGKCRSLENAALCLFKLDKYEEAIITYKERTSYLEFGENTYNAIWLNYELANCYYMNNELRMSILHADKSLNISKSLNLQTSILNAYVLLGKSYASLDHEKSLSCYGEASTILKASGDNEDTLKIIETAMQQIYDYKEQ